VILIHQRHRQTDGRHAISSTSRGKNGRGDECNLGYAPNF